MFKSVVWYNKKVYAVVKKFDSCCVMTKEEKIIEEKIRKRLEAKFRRRLPEKELKVGKYLHHKFDLVSNGKHIVGEIKNYKFKNETTGKTGYTTTRKARLFQACVYLEKVKAKKKLIAITNEAVAKEFAKNTHGLLKDIQILYVPLKGTIREILPE